MQNSAESIDSLNLHRVIEWILRNVRDRGLETDTTMWRCCVVVPDEYFEHTLEMAPVPDEQPIEVLPARGANESHGERIGTRCVNRFLDDASTDVSKDFIEGTDTRSDERQVGTAAGADDGERSQQIDERAHAEALEQQTRAHIEEVESAVGRVDDGSYGMCARCGKPIDPARLEALPEVTLCSPCKPRPASPLSCWR